MSLVVICCYLLFLTWGNGHTVDQEVNDEIETTNKEPEESATTQEAPPPGDLGSPVDLGRLEGEERAAASEGWTLHAFNE